MASKRKANADDNNNEVSIEKKIKSGQKYRESYRSAFPCVGPSKKGTEFFFCSVCEKDLSCSHGGKDDCRRHVKSKAHTELNELKLTQKPMKTFCKPSASEQDKIRAVTKAEASMCHIITGLNLSLSSADTLTKYFKEMFPDSRIAGGKYL